MSELPRCGGVRGAWGKCGCQRAQGVGRRMARVGAVDEGRAGWGNRAAVAGPRGGKRGREVERAEKVSRLGH